MNTIVRRAKQVEMPETFASKKVDMMGVRHIQLNGQNVDDIVVPEEHKLIVRERIKKYENNPESYLSWDDIEALFHTSRDPNIWYERMMN